MMDSLPKALEQLPVSTDRFATFVVGMSASCTRRVSETDVVLFAAVTGDLNPVHVDEEAAQQSRFGERIAHGMLSGGLISALLGADLPGPGSVYLSQSMRFVRPIRIGETVTVRAEIIELFATRRRVRLATTCRDSRNELLVDGEAVVMVPAVS